MEGARTSKIWEQVMGLSSELLTWFVNFRPNRTARMRLFCFPYAGGGPHVFRTWNSILPDWVELQVVQLPGHGTRILEQPYRSLPELLPDVVEAMLPMLDRPYAFFGHSLGALISYEIALRLQKQIPYLPSHLFVSAREAPHLPDTEEPIFQLPDEAFILKLKEYNGTPRQVLLNPELMEIFLPVLRADFQINETYQHLPGEKLRCPLTVIGGSNDTRIPVETLQAWEELSLQPVGLHIIPGDHFFLHTAQEELVQLIAGKLSDSQPE
jgi:medium-chain acyl-[acyl-carrier-protein] hydrolase